MLKLYIYKLHGLKNMIQLIYALIYFWFWREKWPGHVLMYYSTVEVVKVVQYLTPVSLGSEGKRVTWTPGVTGHLNAHSSRQKANSAFPTAGFLYAYRNCSTFQHLPTQWLGVAPEGPGPRAMHVTCQDISVPLTTAILVYLKSVKMISFRVGCITSCQCVSPPRMLVHEILSCIHLVKCYLFIWS